MANKKNNKKFSKDEFDPKEERRGGRGGSKKRGSNGKSLSKGAPSSDDFLNGKAGSNDPTWWNRTGQIAKDSANFAFQGANGAKLRGFELGTKYFTAPGVMVLDYVPTMGTIDGPTHPVNVAARILYDRVNSKNSRTPTYDPSDLMVYILALGNAWSLHSWVRRVVGTYNTFDPNNRYWPKAIRQAMGCAPDYSDQLIVAWRQVANWMASRLNIFNVPADIPYFQRAIFMNNAVYMDSPSSKASYILFNPRALLKLVDADAAHPENVGGLVYEEFPSNIGGGITPEIIWNYFEKLTAPLFNDSIIPTMSADIEKSYGLEKCFRLPNIDDTEMTVPVYNPEMLMQINNARFYPYKSIPGLLTKYAVRQDMTSNSLKAALKIQWDGQLNDMGTFYGNHADLAIPINFPMDNPSVDATIEATRLMWAIDPVAAEGGASPNIGTTSTEMLVDSYIFHYAESNENEWVLNVAEHPQEFVAVTSEPLSLELIRNTRLYLQFGWAPLFTTYWKATAQNAIAKSRLWNDVYNYSTLVYHDLKVLNDACWLSITGAM